MGVGGTPVFVETNIYCDHHGGLAGRGQVDHTRGLRVREGFVVLWLSLMEQNLGVAVGVQEAWVLYEGWLLLLSGPQLLFEVELLLIILVPLLLNILCLLALEIELTHLL